MSPVRRPPRRPLRDPWTERATDPCGGCGHDHVYDFEVRCAGCDRGLCSHCWVILRASIVCAECADAEEES